MARKAKAAPEAPLRDVGCPNTHKRIHVCLTPKQLATVLASLRSTAGLRGEAERLYIAKLMEGLHAQARTNPS